MPASSTTRVKAALYPRYSQLNVPDPRKAYLKDSTIEVIGLSKTRVRKVPPKKDSGKITGVAYMSN